MANDSEVVKQDPRVIQEPRYNSFPNPMPSPFSPEKGDLVDPVAPPLNFPPKTPFKNIRDGK